MMGATQSRVCEQQATVFFLQDPDQPMITTFAIMGLMPVIYFKFVSQLDDSEYQKTIDYYLTVACQAGFLKISTVETSACFLLCSSKLILPFPRLLIVKMFTLFQNHVSRS
jgi:hypothetical protein